MANIDWGVISADFEGYYVAALTDEYIVGCWPVHKDKLNDKDSRILEIRVFNRDGEHKWSRQTVGGEFTYRYLSDDNDVYEEPITGYQLFDIKKIDGKYPKTPGVVSTANGGSYYMPIAISDSDEPVIVYKSYVPKLIKGETSTVHSYAKDWRLSDFCVDRKRG